MHRFEITGTDGDDAITPARVREIHRELRAKREAGRGESFVVLNGCA